jgi:hypothetical protein
MAYTTYIYDETVGPIACKMSVHPIYMLKTLLQKLPLLYMHGP